MGTSTHPDLYMARVLEAATRQDFVTFIQRGFRELHSGTALVGNWHIVAIAWHLEQIRIGTINRLIISMPPRSLKSIIASVAFPAFVHGRDPTKKFICVSYAQTLAAKHHNDYRALVRSRFYRQLFPNTQINTAKDSEGETTLTAGGMRMATSVGGTLTGRGADIIILDDPLKADDAMSDAKRQAANEWYGSSLVSRLNDKNTGAIVIISQRLHMDDLIGFVCSSNTGEWEILELPAIADSDRQVNIGDDKYHLYRKGQVLQPDREPLAVLEKLRNTMGSDTFSAQYQQAPVPPGGAMFKRAWVKRYDRVPQAQTGDEIIQSWDTASKDGPSNDWSVATTWLKRDGLYFLLDCFRKRLDYPALRHAAIDLGRRYDPHMVLVEDAGIGTALIADLRSAELNSIGVQVNRSKEARASVESAKFEGGRVYFPNRAPWLDELEHELFAFPGSKHDDQVDSIAQALGYASPRNKTTTRIVRIY